MKKNYIKGLIFIVLSQFFYINNVASQTYKISTISDASASSNFCIPLSTVDSVKNIIGYDLVLNYDKSNLFKFNNFML